MNWKKVSRAKHVSGDYSIYAKITFTGMRHLIFRKGRLIGEKPYLDQAKTWVSRHREEAAAA